VCGVLHTDGDGNPIACPNDHADSYTITYYTNDPNPIGDPIGDAIAKTFALYDADAHPHPSTYSFPDAESIANRLGDPDDH